VAHFQGDNMKKDLTTAQKDYAQFLPAISGFYATFIGKQRYSNYVDPQRVPKSFANGVESLNLLDPDKGAFYYKWFLYSAGHANLDLNKEDDTEDMFRKRDRTTSFGVADSGGYQIAKACWPADWKDPTCPAAMKKREQVLTWMDSLFEYGMCLDVPAWVIRSEKGRAATKITTYQEAVTATSINNDYFINNRNGNCKFLNVMQGNTHEDADDWYNRMKKYCDPAIYPGRNFDGWSLGGQHTGDVHLALSRIVQMRFDGLLEKGVHDRMHFLGISRLEWAVLLTDIQRAVRKYHNENFTISFDCASPFLATANGQLYIYNRFNNRDKWSYKMVPGIDDKKYAQDYRLFKDMIATEGHFNFGEKDDYGRIMKFQSSPIIDQCTARDICYYDHGDLNKNGKEGKTSWDSFSYAIQMGHNLYRHIDAVQEANRRYDKRKIPGMLVQKNFEEFCFRDIVEAIFATSDYGEAMKVIDHFSSYWTSIIGTRGMTGGDNFNAKTIGKSLFKADDNTGIEDWVDTENLSLASTTDESSPATKFNELFSGLDATEVKKKEKPKFRIIADNKFTTFFNGGYDHADGFSENEEDTLDALEENLKK
jgi:hypothetical protein